MNVQKWNKAVPGEVQNGYQDICFYAMHGQMLEQPSLRGADSSCLSVLKRHLNNALNDML